MQCKVMEAGKVVERWDQERNEESGIQDPSREITYNEPKNINRLIRSKENIGNQATN